MSNVIAQVTLSDLRRRSLFIATPMYGGVNHGGYTSSMVKLNWLLRSNGINYYYKSIANESLIQRARNYLADDFMRSGYTHFLFVDSDIEFDPSNVIQMLALADYHSNFDIVCGPYSKKTIAWEKIIFAIQQGSISDPNQLEQYVGDYVFNLIPDKNGKAYISLNKPVEVQEGGTGFMLIQRKVFEKFADAYPDRYYYPDHKRQKYFDGSRKIVAYFDSIIDRNVTEQEIWDLLRRAAKGEKITKEAQDMVARHKKASLRYWSEDYYFCQMVRKLGMKVWLCPWMKTRHYGTYAFGGSLEALLSIGANPTYGKTAVNVQTTKEE